MSRTTPDFAVVWHDLECGGYDVDHDLWETLAAGASSSGHARVLDVGAGTGRVSLRLAQAGHQVTAVDVDATLIDELKRRAAARGIDVDAYVQDARSLDVPAEFDLIIVPMQTLQLLGGPQGRTAFLHRAAGHLRRSGLLAAALADPFEGVGEDRTEPPAPDVDEIDGWLVSSQPIEVRYNAGRNSVTIARIRQTRAPDGHMTAEGNEIDLDVCDPVTVAHEAIPLGFAQQRSRRVDGTEDYVGSDVVVLRRV